MSSQGRYSILLEVQTGNAVSQINALKNSLGSLNTLTGPIRTASHEPMIYSLVTMSIVIFMIIILLII